VIDWLSSVARLMAKIATEEMTMLPKSALAVLEQIVTVRETECNRRVLLKVLEVLPLLWTIAARFPEELGWLTLLCALSSGATDSARALGEYPGLIRALANIVHEPRYKMPGSIKRALQEIVTEVTDNEIISGCMDSIDLMEAELARFLEA